MTAPMHSWPADPLTPAVAAQLERLRRMDGVRHVAVMPDVHLAHDVCIGTVVATSDRLFPACVGGDIGCGVATIAFDGPAALVAAEAPARAGLARLGRLVPILSQPRGHRHALPDELTAAPLSTARLERLKRTDAVAQLGTVGRGNHFIELQEDEAGRLWALVHSGSRCVGPTIRGHFLPGGGLGSLAADSPEGEAYLADVAWAVAYARKNRELMLHAVAAVVHRVVGLEPSPDTWFDCDHNHVAREGDALIHRKGAIRAGAGEPGIIPGSMGAPTFHTLGRGCADGLNSSSHGAGRVMSRTEARQTIGKRRLLREMHGVWFDRSRAADLVTEAPGAYRDIRHVMRAQQDLTRIVRTLTPVINYKAAG